MRIDYNAANAAKEISQNKTRMSKDEVDRLFEKQAATKARNAAASKRDIIELMRQQEAIRKRKRDDLTDPLNQHKRSLEDRRRELTTARREAENIQNHKREKHVTECYEILKVGILQGILHVRETEDGYEFDTSQEKIEEYLLQQMKLKGLLPEPDDLTEGRFLFGTVNKYEWEHVKVVRDRLIEEFGADSPTKMMLVDVAVSNYTRAMYATGMEYSLLWNTDRRYDMLELTHISLEPYIHACQNQLLKTVAALRASCERPPRNSWSMKLTYRRTDLNLQKWGRPLLHALRDVASDKKEIDLDEVKLAMKRYADGIDVDSIRNSDIAYVMNELGFVKKIHTEHGNRYLIRKEEVEVLLRQTYDLKT
jgi:hypothetical protein